MAGSARSFSNRSGVAARLLEAVLALPVHIDSRASSQLELSGAASFARRTTIVELHGGGHVGRGEDIAYSADAQAVLPERFAQVDLAGSWTIGSLASHLDTVAFDVPDAMGDDKAGYHRWALEAAALDLALRQRGTDLAGLIGEPWRPVRVVLSMGLGEPPSLDVVRGWLDRDPSVAFKLDASMAWDHALVARLAQAAGGSIETVDFKALYTGDWIDNDYPPALYEAVANGLPAALLEDARLDADTQDALDESALGRLAWDSPITQPEDIPGLPGSTASFSDLRPAAINIKPSRFGSLERLFGTIMRCDDDGIPCYAGGQYELGIGRTQVQQVASLCFPVAPNDIAPAMFHGATPDAEDVPLGAVHVPRDGGGFGWDAPTRATVV